MMYLDGQGTSFLIKKHRLFQDYVFSYQKIYDTMLKKYFLKENHL